MKRFDDWYPRLAAYVSSVRRLPFEYGRHDCALFAAGAVAAMTGIDPAAKLRGKYSTLAGGLKKLRRLGFDNHADFAASILPEVIEGPAFAQIGDIAAFDLGGAWSLGLVQGSRIFVTQPDSAGLGSVDLLTASRLFRV
ncbi:MULTISPECIES: hypothetical protein [unclassified Ensifer]|uniref:DUF6950 family protein n=1 Tax=unclassified Ensifer TaxID=2633371 RepID=UPI0008134ECE|nr:MULTISPECIES: hypothetical protein [unclassified Ensifer]OCP04994.1 hypothetical protein BC362_14640 [Ensifer sp. LC14]OCP11847.1 hypothetical protein BC374_16365 [Ensifer sp. LC13]OCP12404.1 hypothetical protein BBX50_16565 [Ensifer sp. LC11]OCP33629.1 hypothetical protein BC364_15280 [Ensifer sp. LC499]